MQKYLYLTFLIISFLLSKWYIHLKGMIFFTYKIDMIFFFFQTPDSIEISYNTISLKGILALEFKAL